MVLICTPLHSPQLTYVVQGEEIFSVQSGKRMNSGSRVTRGKGEEKLRHIFFWLFFSCSVSKWVGFLHGIRKNKQRFIISFFLREDQENSPSLDESASMQLSKCRPPHQLELFKITLPCLGLCSSRLRYVLAFLILDCLQPTTNKSTLFSQIRRVLHKVLSVKLSVYMKHCFAPSYSLRMLF